MISVTQRSQLSDFLKACRARLSPTDVGLPESSRRRRPGLRREDVAALGKMSITWYTWLEQGRDVQASAKMLECLSKVLRLSPDERDYLFALAQNRPPPLESPGPATVRPAVQRMLDGLPVPALVMTSRWDVVAWNRMMTLIFRDYSAMAPEQRNLLKILLTNPIYQTDPTEYDRIARRVLAKLRVDYSHSAGDPTFDALIEDLRQICPVFRELWHTPEVTGRSEGIQIVQHPMVGKISLEHTSYVVEGASHLKAIIFVPVDGESAQKIDRVARTKLSSAA